MINHGLLLDIWILIVFNNWWTPWVILIIWKHYCDVILWYIETIDEWNALKCIFIFKIICSTLNWTEIAQIDLAKPMTIKSDIPIGTKQNVESVDNWLCCFLRKVAMRQLWNTSQINVCLAVVCLKTIDRVAIHKEAI